MPCTLSPLLQIVHLAHISRTLNRRHPRLGRAALAASEPQLPSFRPGQLAWLASLCVSSHLRYNLADLRMTRLVVERGLAVAQGLPTPQAATQLLSAAASVRLRAPRHQQVGTLGLAAHVQLGSLEHSLQHDLWQQAIPPDVRILAFPACRCWAKRLCASFPTAIRGR